MADKRLLLPLARRARIHSEAINFLRENGLPDGLISKFLELVVKHRTGHVDVDPTWNPMRMEVEKKAIDIVRERETEQEWHTTPRNNKGFDLYQTDDGQPGGTITRWCEVKSLSSTFNSRQPVELTRPEFEMAQARGESYWLYIVEGVKNPESTKIIKIKDPAGKTGRFTFSDPWRDFAEK